MYIYDEMKMFCVFTNCRNVLLFHFLIRLNTEYDSHKVYV